MAGPLTVDVDVAADVGAAEGVGDLAGDRFGEEGVVHNDLIRVSRDLLDYTSSFCPPGDKNRDSVTGPKKKKPRRGRKRGSAFARCRVNSILWCE